MLNDVSAVFIHTSKVRLLLPDGRVVAPVATTWDWLWSDTAGASGSLTSAPGLTFWVTLAGL